MDHQQWSLRIDSAVIICALLLRLWAGGLFDPVVSFLSQPRVLSFLTYLETGQHVQFPADSAPLEVFALELPQTEPETQPQLQPETVPADPWQIPVFSPADGENIEFKYGCKLRPDAAELITQPLNWDLTGTKPRVLILHTHTTEAYTPTPDTQYEQEAAFRTLDEAYNMVAVGDRVAQLLEEAGIGVIHDQEIHDYPSYNGSYNHARKAVAEYLEEYPEILLVLDLHRDASGSNTSQMRPTVTVNGQTAAQLMLVVGTNAGGLTHPNWEENLALGLKLHRQLQRIAPGICRPLNLRAQRFNQDQSPGALLIEVGAAGNTQQEALLAAELLAKAVIQLSQGATTAGSTS